MDDDPSVYSSSCEDLDTIADHFLSRFMGPRFIDIAHIRINQKLWDTAFRKVPSIKYNKRYLVGSFSEAMPHSICGDQDFMYNQSINPVVLWKFEPGMKYHKCGYVIAEQNKNEPAYLTLKVNSNWPLHEYLKNAVNGNGYMMPGVFIKTVGRIQLFKDVHKMSRKHGPSVELTLTNSNSTKLDVISCLKCQSPWPSNLDFFNRKRQNNWPTLPILKKMSKLDCLIVGTGHQNSTSKELEWRLSFSVAERELCFELSEPYPRCMLALKTIKASKCLNIFSKSDSPTPFCSYFIKTACFWMCETFPSEGHSTMDLIRETIDWLIKCYQQRRLPHYFIPQQNLIGHLSSKHCEEVIVSLKAIKYDLWCNVMVSVTAITDVHYKQMYGNDLYSGFKDYKKIESALMNSKSKIEKMKNMFYNLKKKDHISRVLTALTFSDFSRIIQQYMHEGHDPLEVIKLDKLILSVLKGDDSIPNGYKKVFKHSLYYSLGDVYLGLLKFLQSNLRKNVHGYLNKPLEYYKKKSVLVYPDGWSDNSIGSEISVIKYYYLMNEEKKLKEMLAKFEPVLNKVKRNKDVMKKLRGILVNVGHCQFLDAFAWNTIDNHICDLAKSSSGNLHFNPIVFIFYVNARVSLKEGDIYKAYMNLNEMKSSLTVIESYYYKPTQSLIKIIEQLLVNILYKFWILFRKLEK